MPETLTGTIKNKQFIELDELSQLAFILVAKNPDGQEAVMDCHAYRETARHLNHVLSNGCTARITFRQPKKNALNFRSTQVINARMLKMPDDSDQPPAIEARPIPTAWGLWRQGQGWFQKLKPAKRLQRNKAVVFVEESTKAAAFKIQDDCREQQKILELAFGCHTLIKPLRFE